MRIFYNVYNFTILFYIYLLFLFLMQKIDLAIQYLTFLSVIVTLFFM